MSSGDRAASSEQASTDATVPAASTERQTIAGGPGSVDNVSQDAKSACPTGCGGCGNLADRFAELFGAVDIRLSVGLWLSAILPLVFSFTWLAGDYGSVAISPIQLPSEFLSAMTGPLLLVLTGLVLSVYAGSLNLGVWGVAAMSCVLFRAFYSVIGVGEIAGAIVVLLGFFAGRAMLSVHKKCRFRAIVLSLILGLAGNAISLWMHNHGYLGGLLASSPWRVVRISVLCFVAVLLWLMLPQNSKGHKAATLSGTHKKRLFIASYICAVVGGVLAGMSGNIVGTGGILGDMRVLAALSLALVPLHRGSMTVLLSCLLAPLSLLTANLWLLGVGPMLNRVDGDFSMILMAVMIFGARLIALGRGFRVLRRLSALAAAGGVIITAAVSYWQLRPQAEIWLIVGISIWLAGFITGIVRLGLVMGRKQHRFG